MVKIKIFTLLFILSIRIGTAQDIGFCPFCENVSGIDQLSQIITQIYDYSHCYNGSRTRLFDSVFEARCNQFQITTYKLGDERTPRYDEYLTLAGRNFNFTLGNSRVSDKISEANRSYPPNIFNGYVSFRNGGCARTPFSLRQVRRNYCFVFAREIEAKADGLIDAYFNHKSLDEVHRCLYNAQRSYQAQKTCFYQIFDLSETWKRSIEDEVIRAKEEYYRHPIFNRESELFEFEQNFQSMITKWASDALNSITALSQARTLAREAALRQRPSTAGGCEERLGALFNVWPDLFQFNAGAPYNKSYDFAYCMNKQNKFDQEADAKRYRLARNLVMGLGFVASIAAIPLTGGSSGALAASLISGVANTGVGAMTIVEGARKDNMIPLHMKAGSIRVHLDGNTPEANRRLQQEYDELKKEVHEYYRTGAIRIVTSAFLAGGGGQYVATKLKSLATQHPSTQALITFFEKLGDSPAAKTAMYGLAVAGGSGYIYYKMNSI